MIFTSKDLENSTSNKKNKLSKFLQVIFSDYQNLNKCYLFNDCDYFFLLITTQVFFIFLKNIFSF